MDDFSLARPVGHLIMWDGSGPDGLAEKDGAKALSGAESVDTATTQLDKPSRTKNLINEYYHSAVKYLDTIFCIKFARYLVRSILLLNTFNPDAL